MTPLVRWLPAFVLALAPSAGGQATLLVPETHATIQAGIDAAVNGDTVSVGPGIYSESLDFLGKRIAVRSRAGAIDTVVDADGPVTVVRFTSGETRETLLEGFTLTGGSPDDSGGGILIQNSAPTIRSCRIRGNESVFADGGGIHCFSGHPLIQNCAVHDNDVLFDAPGMYFVGSHDEWAVVLNCVVYRNESFAIDLFGAIASQPGAKVLVANTVSRDNIWSTGVGIAAPGFVMYSNIDGGAPLTNGNIDANPMFLSGTTGDFHLRAASPNRDAGTRLLPQIPGLVGGLPTYDWEGDLRRVGPDPDIGVDEYTLHLYHVGIPAPGATIELRLVGAPPGASCWAWLSSARLAPPLPTAYGPWHLADRRETLFEGEPMPVGEVLVQRYALPPFALHPDELYAQPFAAAQLGNLDILRE